MVEGEFALIFGSLPGPVKRCVALRKSLRPAQQVGIQLQSVEKMIIKN
jgi:ribosomal protein L3